MAVHLLYVLQIPGVERVLENTLDWMIEQGWGFSQTDGLLLGLALVVCGVVTLRAKLFSHWNAVVLLLGLGQVYSNLTFFYWLSASPTIGSGSARIAVIPYLSDPFFACLWGVLGYLLWANHRTTQTVPIVQPQPMSRESAAGRTAVHRS